MKVWSPSSAWGLQREGAREVGQQGVDIANVKMSMNPLTKSPSKRRCA